MTPKVGLARASDRYATVRGALEHVADQLDFTGKRLVLVKPNMVWTSVPLCATHADALRAVLAFIRERYSGAIVVAEGTGNGSGPAAEGFERYGYVAVAKEYDAELFDLNTDEGVNVVGYDRELRPADFPVARMVVEADFRVSLCPAKCHDTVLATLSMKNVALGALIRRQGADASLATKALQTVTKFTPVWLRQTPLVEEARRKIMGGPTSNAKNAVHQGYPAINLSIVSIIKALPINLSVIDGWEGMEGNGPVHGTPVDMRRAFAGIDCVAVDAVCASAMGYDPSGIGYLHFAKLAGLGESDLRQIQQVGRSLDELRRPFKRHQGWEQQLAWRTPQAEEIAKKI